MMNLYVALPIHMHTGKTTATSVKLYINMEMGAKVLYIDKAHAALDILHFAVFFRLKQ